MKGLLGSIGFIVLLSIPSNITFNISYQDLVRLINNSNYSYETFYDEP